MSTIDEDTQVDVLGWRRAIEEERDRAIERRSYTSDPGRRREYDGQIAAYGKALDKLDRQIGGAE